VLLQSAQDVRDRLKLVSRTRTLAAWSSQRATLDAVVNHISTILENKG